MTVVEDRDRQLVSYLRNLYVPALKYKRTMYANWQRNYKLLNNQIGGTASANWQPSPRDSEIYPTCAALVAWMMDQNTDIDITPASDPSSQFYMFFSHLANNLSSVYYSTWLAEDYEAQIKLTVWDSLLYGMGIIKTVWDNSLSDNYGNAKLIRVDPYSFYPDPLASTFDEAEYLIEVRDMTYDEIERRYPDTSRLLDYAPSSDLDSSDQKPDRFTLGGGIPVRNLGGLPSSGAVSNDPGGLGASSSLTRWSEARDADQHHDNPVITVYEYWVKENGRDLDSDVEFSEQAVEAKWRVVVVARGVILLNELAEDLYKRGSHPYERYLWDDIGEMYGIALVDHLAHPQLYINRLLTALQWNTELTGNPVWLESSNSGLERTPITNRPGLRLRGNPQMMNNKPGWIQPPSMPPAVMDLIQFWISRIENTSGLSAIVKGATPTARNAEGVISSIQEAAFVRIRAGLRNLEKTLERASAKALDLIIENYTEPRFLSITGPDGKQTALALAANHFTVPSEAGSTPLKYSLSIKAGASAPTSRQARQSLADKAQALGIIDDEEWLKWTQWPGDIQEMLKRKYDKAAKNVPWGGGGQRQRSQKR